MGIAWGIERTTITPSTILVIAKISRAPLDCK